MSIRRAKNKLTGMCFRKTETVMGVNERGERQITVHFGMGKYLGIKDPDVLAELRRNLDTAARYLDGKPVILEGEESP